VPPATCPWQQAPVLQQPQQQQPPGLVMLQLKVCRSVKET